MQYCTSTSEAGTCIVAKATQEKLKKKDIATYEIPMLHVNWCVSVFLGDNAITHYFMSFVLSANLYYET